MSKAEECALAEYPIKHKTNKKDTGEYDPNLPRRKAFIKGYHQAEKDLIENKHEKSWRLDKQLWSGFKDIEEASYQYIYDASNDWAYEIPTWSDVQDAFKAGAEWKEDLELTLKDIEIILGIENNILHECSDNSQLVIEAYPKGEDYYGEILKRYLKERKEK